MNYLLIITYIVIFLISKVAFKHKYGYQWNSTFITTAIWCVFASIAVINPLGLRQPSLIVHEYSILFLLSFNIFSYIIHIKSDKFIKTKRKDKLIDLTNVNIRIASIEIACIALIIPMLILGFYAILSGNANNYRFEVYFGEDQSFFTKTIPCAILNTIMIISLYLFFRYNNKWHLTNSLLIVVLLSIISAGRGTIFCYIMLYGFMSLYYRKIGTKHSRIPLVIGIIGICCLTIVVRGSDILDSVILYFSGPFSFLDYILDNPQDYGLDTLHYGFITLSPITEPLMYILKVLGLSAEKIPSYYLNAYVQDFVDIGAREMYLFNNNSTTLLHFILDGGWIGIVLGGFFLAYISNKSYLYFINNKIVGAIFYLYVINGLFMTTISYQSFMSITPFITIIITFFCVKPIND